MSAAFSPKTWITAAAGVAAVAGASYASYWLYNRTNSSTAATTTTAAAAADVKTPAPAPAPATMLGPDGKRVPVPEGWIPRGPVPDEECIVPDVPSPTNRLKVVVVHGDPSKPNRILPGGWWDEDDYDAVNTLKKALSKLSACYDFEFLCSHDTLIDDLKKRKQEKKVDLILQFCDEGFNNDPRQELHMTAMLEALKIPFTGTGTHSIAFSYDKDFVLNVCKSLRVPVPDSQYFAPHEDPMTHTLSYPILVKPNSTDGSYGITSLSVCHNAGDLRRALDMMRDTFKLKKISILVQEYLPGKDVNFAILGNPILKGAANSGDDRKEPEDDGKPRMNADGSWSGEGSIVLPVTEEDYSAVPADLPRVLGFESKWLPNSPYWLIKTVATKLSAAQQKLIVECSHKLFARLGYRDYARFDWRCDGDGNPRLLEVNPNCGWCWDGHLAKTAATAGVDYPALMDRILRTAWARHRASVSDRLSNAPANMDELVKTLGSAGAGAAAPASSSA